MPFLYNNVETDVGQLASNIPIEKIYERYWQLEDINRSACKGGWHRLSLPFGKASIEKIIILFCLSNSILAIRDKSMLLNN